MEKRKASLADAFINHRYTAHDPMTARIPLKTIGDLQLKAMKATKYIFDDAASTRVGEVVRDIPELIIKEARFARAPYDLTWIEWNVSLFWRTLHADKIHLAAPDHAVRIGVIIDGDDVYCIAGGAADKPNRLDLCYVTPFAYTLNIDPSKYDHLPEEQRFRRGGGWMDYMANFFWGHTSGKFPQEVLHEASRSFSASPLIERYQTLRGDTPAVLMEECSGDLRNIIAILLMLNRPSITHYKQTLPNTRGFLRNKVVPFMSHTSVTVSLSLKPMIQLLSHPDSNGESETRRWGRVEGHYCHNKDARDYLRIAGCIHEWIDTDEDWTPLAGAYAPSKVNHWICKACEGKRWWREYPHGRGDKTKGIVVKDQYNVVP